ncbi:MAG: guanylate kinase [Chloracidobacterium sp.]|nr:guanylate kinase [Chloracidobacterium sp.]
MKGNLVIIAAPSGAGKGTLIKEVLQTVPELEYSVSLTTRPRRPGEIDGKDYHFVTRRDFEEFRVQGGFLEYAEVHGNLYGTSRKFTEDLTGLGKDVILEIDVQGAASVLEQVPDAISIFIMPPSFEALRARLEARGTESAEDLDLRLRNSIDEVSRYDLFKFVVVNDEVSSAAARLRAVIMGERQLRTRQTDAIRDILDSFDVSKLIHEDS